jgi:hypothetical protein
MKTWRTPVSGFIGVVPEQGQAVGERSWSIPSLRHGGRIAARRSCAGARAACDATYDMSTEQRKMRGDEGEILLIINNPAQCRTQLCDRALAG